MKLGPEVWSLVYLTVFCIGIQWTMAQYDGNTFGDYNYQSYNYGGMPEYSYDNQDSIPEALCYNCVYHLKQGHASGFDNCRDPFIPFGIHETSCKGACAKIYIKTSDTEYTISRSCMPNCMNHLDDTGYTECCTGRLCNGAKDSAGHKGIQWVMAHYGGNNRRHKSDNNGGKPKNTYDARDPIPKALCYNCIFHLKQGHSSGFDNCRDPFLPYGIHEMSCRGACAKIYIKISDTEYTISRTCIPNCMNHQDETGYTECCTVHFCNGAKDGSEQKGHWALIASVVATLWALS